MKSNFIYRKLFVLLYLSCFSSLTAQQPRFSQLDHYYKSLTWYELGFFDWSEKEGEFYLSNTFVEPENRTQQYITLRTKQYVDTLSADVFAQVYINEWPTALETVSLQLEIAHKANKERRFADAIKAYEKALELDIHHKMGDRIYYWLSETARSANKPFEARVYLLKLADTYPKSPLAPSALYARGALLLSEKQLEKATEAFELLKKRYPNDKVTQRIRTALGEAYYQQRQFDKCITELKEQLPLLKGEEESKAVFIIAESYNYLNRFDEAAANYLRYANLTKGSSQERFAQYGLAWVYHKQQVYHWSAESFAKASVGDDEIARKALYYKAINEKLAGLYPKSMATFEEFGKRYKMGFWVEEAYYEWAVSSFEFGDYAKAIEILLHVIRNQPALTNKGQILSLLGEAYYANGEYTRALQTFEEAEKSVQISDEIKIQALFQKAWLLYRNQAYDQARPGFEKVYKNTPNHPLAAEALFWAADCFYNVDDFGPAGERFGQFVTLYPNHSFAGAALYSKGWAAFKMGKFEESIQPFEQFLSSFTAPPIALYPYDIDAFLRLGDAHYALREYDTAIAYYTKAIGADPGGDYALFQIGNCYYRSDRTYEAVTNFRKMVRIYPYSRLREQAQYNIGYVYFLMGNYDQAITELTVVINKYFETSWAARAQYNIGDAYYNAGKYDLAVEAYQKVLKNHPKSEFILEAINGIQYAQLASGKEDTSEKLFEDFIYQHPSSRAADRLRFRQAENLLQVGDYPATIRSLIEYIRISTNKRSVSDARYSLAEAYRLNNEEEKAIAELISYYNDYPDMEKTPVVLSQLGRIFLAKHNYSEAERYFSLLDQRFTAYKAEALTGLGNVELGRQDYEKARGYFQTALRLFPNNETVKLGLAKVHFELEEDELAISQLTEIAQKNTGAEGAEAQFLLGRILQDQNKFSEALNAFAKVKILYEAYEYWVAKALYESAKCYQKLGNPVEAKKTLKLILERYADTQTAKEASALLNQ